MRHFFINGRTPELSIAEVLSVLSSEHISYSKAEFYPAATLLSAEKPLEHLMFRLGGTLKYGELLPEEYDFNENLAETILELVNNHFSGDGRITFGFSLYHTSTDSKKIQPGRNSLFRLAVVMRNLGLAVKKELKSAGHSVRFVAPQQNAISLSSVVVTKNKLVGQGGFEFVFFLDGNRCRIGITRAVQPFEEYSERDWSRPHRGMTVGLLPPKLAQMMINLSGKAPEKSVTLLDPFCGFGTVMQEALLIGFTDVLSSDKAQQLVGAARDNIAWLLEEKLTSLSFEVEKRITTVDATKLSSHYKKNSIDAIVTEPYLGPIISGKTSVREMDVIRKDLTVLYTQFLREAHTILKEDGVVAMVWPVWIIDGKKYFLPINDDLGSLGFKNTTIPDDFTGAWPSITDRKTILYLREGQHVGREVIVLKVK